jgi:hypothetical protein
MRANVSLLIVLMMGCGGGDDDATVARTKCESLRDHLVELRLATATNVDVAAHRAAMRKAMGNTFITDCESKLSARAVDCALHATDSTAAAACSTPTE